MPAVDAAAATTAAQCGCTSLVFLVFVAVGVLFQLDNYTIMRLRAMKKGLKCMDEVHRHPAFDGTCLPLSRHMSCDAEKKSRSGIYG